MWAVYGMGRQDGCHDIFFSAGWEGDFICVGRGRMRQVGGWVFVIVRLLLL